MLTKILLKEDAYVETPWAEALGGNHYRLDNIPFWKYDVSVGDVVEALPDDSGRPAFVRVVAKSGNRTVRVRLVPPMDESPESHAVIDELVRRGCDFEGMHPGYVAVNVPPQIDLDAVAHHLVMSGQEWEYADPALPADAADAADETDGGAHEA